MAPCKMSIAQYSVSQSTTTTVDILRNISQPSSASTRTLNGSGGGPTLESIRRLVDVLLADYSSDFISDLDVCQSSKPSASCPPETPAQFEATLHWLQRCTISVLEESQLSWGRILTVLAFYAELCRRWQSQTMDRPSGERLKVRGWIKNELAEDFACFLDDHVGAWVAAHGGWNHLASRSSSQSTKSCVKGGVFGYLSVAVMGMGIGTLLGLMVVR